MLANNGQDRFAIRRGNSRSGGLTTTCSGPEPPNQRWWLLTDASGGGIVLGTGGDNSNKGVGEFFECVMTSGVPASAADNAVQANIVAAHYSGD